MNDNTDAPRLPDGYEFSADPARIDVDRTHHWLATDAYWAIDRPREKHERAVAGSLNFGVYDTASGQQVAYARVVTDHATVAWLCDVYVDRNHRGRGLGTMMAETVAAELRPLRLKRVILSTLDAHDVYARVGFEPMPHPERLMILGR